MAPESRTLDRVDRQILHALGIAPRAPFARIATVLDVSHTTTGYSLRLRFEAELEGPCMRCLEAAEHTVDRAPAPSYHSFEN